MYIFKAAARQAMVGDNGSNSIPAGAKASCNHSLTGKGKINRSRFTN